jgi:hypothetical protein
MRSRAECHDDSGDLMAQGEGRVGPVTALTRENIQVGAAQARGPHLDQDLVRPWFWYVHIRELAAAAALHYPVSLHDMGR